MSDKIPFHIISGFLGSGKTTFLKRIINTVSEKFKLGIIQNEFAPTNIDGAELKRTGKNFNLLEINNGSVFCVCLLGDFVRSLGDFIVQYKPDAVIIEASGLSDTTSVVEIISAGPLGEKLYLASNWCIVDAPNYAKAGLMKQRVNQQIRMADIVLINKVDLVKDHYLSEEIKKLNPFAEIKETVYCNVDFELGKSAVSKFYMDSAAPMKRPEINSMVLKSGRRISRESLEAFINEWAPKAYRIKGYVNVTGGKTVSVQCTFDNVEFIETYDYYGPSELIALTGSFSMREWNKSFKKYS
jgi:G3E family GTPase